MRIWVDGAYLREFPPSAIQCHLVSSKEKQGGGGNAIHNSSPAQMLCHYPDVNSISTITPELPETMHTYYLAVWQNALCCRLSWMARWILHMHMHSQCTATSTWWGRPDFWLKVNHFLVVLIALQDCILELGCISDASPKISMKLYFKKRTKQ